MSHGHSDSSTTSHSYSDSAGHSDSDSPSHSDISTTSHTYTESHGDSVGHSYIDFPSHSDSFINSHIDSDVSSAISQSVSDSDNECSTFDFSSPSTQAINQKMCILYGVNQSGGGGGGGGDMFVSDDQTSEDGSSDDMEEEVASNPEPDWGTFYEIQSVRERTVQKFNTTGWDYTMQFRQIESVSNVSEILGILHGVFNHLLSRLLDGVAPTDQVRISFDSPYLNRDIYVPFVPAADMTVERILAKIEHVLQSNEDFVLDGNVSIRFVHVAIPQGQKGGRANRRVNLDEKLHILRSTITIQNCDEMCCARAIVTAVSHSQRETDPDWNNVRQGRHEQGRRAAELHVKADVPIGPCSLTELAKFQSVLPDVKIHVLSKESFGGIIYKGPDDEYRHHIYLYHYNNHYDVITTMSGFMQKSYFCRDCFKGYDHREEHTCKNHCPCCLRKPNCELVLWKYCDDCHRYFKSTDCYQQHKVISGKSSTCNILRRCEICGKSLTRKHRENHLCGMVVCNICKEEVDAESHLCYIQPIATKSTDVVVDEDQEEEDEEEEREAEEDPGDDDANTRYIFFDFECMQTTNGIHVPNLCVAQTSDGRREEIFEGASTVDDFCRWLFSYRHYGYTCIAHNLKGYDGHFILPYCYEQGILPEVIMNGSKIMSIEIKCMKMRFIDSLNFFNMSLSKLPETFGLEDNVKKGYFPHFFNTPENYSYVGTLPDASYYGPDGMKPKEKQKFDDWYAHESAKEVEFHLKEELRAYCQNDVDILRMCCLAFRKEFLEITGTDPFQSCITIASACNLVFRKLFLQPETIGIIPPGNYNKQINHSAVALKWLSWIEVEEKIDIRHARKGGEKKIGNYLVDGFCEETNTVYEMLGCYWHGCPKCYDQYTCNSTSGIIMKDLLSNTMDRTRKLRNMGYTVVEMWECQFRRLLTSNIEMKSFVESLELVDVINPRDAFYGGRVNATRLYHSVNEGEMIKYVDFTSLYPWVNKYAKYPTRHPEVITKEFKADIFEYFGFVKCKVSPPRLLYHPVLPYRSEGKLLFPLCAKCVDNQQQSTCEHTDEDRCLLGTWVTPELKKAVEMGYKIVKVYEVWHYDSSEQYNPETQRGGLFSEYINTFLKIKQESSGWPVWCVDDDLQMKYIDDYYSAEGIHLEASKICQNPGRRAMAKMMLNSMWGKFGQRSNMPKTQYVNKPVEYFSLMTSDDKEVVDIDFVNEDILQVQWRKINEFVESPINTNVSIASFTTAYARLKLYEILDLLGHQVLYYDTDSIIYIQLPGESEPPLGDYLGQLTDELSPPNNYITTFVSGGPKNYSYKLNEPDKGGNLTVCKVRGITLNFKNAQQINFNTVCQMVTGTGAQKITVSNPHCIARKKRHIITRRESKDYRVVYTKRVLQDDYDTLPYGY